MKVKPPGPGFYANARTRLRKRAAAAGLDGLLILQVQSLTYATGLFLTACERPMGLWLPVEGEPILLMPELEHENAEAAGIADLRFYEEFPGKEHPVLWMLREIGPLAIGIDRLEAALLRSAQTLAARIDLTDYPMLERMVKTPEEIALTAEAARFADMFLERLHDVGGDMISQGATESDLMNAGLVFASDALKAAHGGSFAGTKMAITASVHSGPRAALPHGTVLARQPQAGETLIAGIGACLGGYHAESGATWIVGEINAEQRGIMAAMRACNDSAVAALAKGARCAEVNQAAMATLRQAGLGAAIRHRIGHGMGLEGHEAPWLAPGDETPVAPNMIFSNEPGVYRPRIDGYRTINTMIVTETGVDIPSRFQAGTPIEERVLAL